MIALLVHGFAVGEPVGQHPAEDTEELESLVVRQLGPVRSPGAQVCSARGGTGSKWDRDMVDLLWGVYLLDDRTSGPARAAPRGRRPQPSFYRLRQRPPREGGSVVAFFVFRSRRGDRIKVLYWDKDGYALWYKRLEKGSFRFPTVSAEGATKGVEVKAADLMMILDGVDLGSVRRQRRYSREAVENP
jgi:hypothetical protein